MFSVTMSLDNRVCTYFLFCEFVMANVCSGYSSEVDGLREKMRENERAVHALAASLQ